MGSLIRLFPFLKLVTGRVWVYVALASMAASFSAGVWVRGKFAEAAQVHAVNVARAQERDAVSLGSAADGAYLKWLSTHKEIADDKISKLEKRLAKVKPCPVPVPPEWLRRQPDVPATAPVAGSDRATPEAVDTVADARDVVRTCERNRLEVHEPNAEQLRALQAWYEDLRRGYNQ